MVSVRSPRTRRTIPFLIAVCLATLPVHAKYSGGTGEPNDPYQIATAADLIALGETPEDYDKHFILTADIDLDPNLPGRKVFDRAVIAPNNSPGPWSSFDGPSFTGVFDGQGHTIRHLTIAGEDYLGLFGSLGDSRAKITDLGLEAVSVKGTQMYVGGLAGRNGGSISMCHSAGSVVACAYVGGLLGWNGGTVIQCHSTGAVRGIELGVHIGGLVGWNDAEVTECYDTGSVSGTSRVGGLVGENNGGCITASHSDSMVSGDSDIGGLAGMNSEKASIVTSHSSGSVDANDSVGGLAGRNDGSMIHCYSTGPATGNNAGGLVGLNWGTVTRCHSTGPVRGTGLAVYVGGLVGQNNADLTQSYSTGSVSANEFVGGLVGRNDGSILHCSSTGEVNGTDAGGLVGLNWGVVTRCYSRGAVSGYSCIGGLVGFNGAGVMQCYSAGMVSGDWNVGGLVGNDKFCDDRCYQSGFVAGSFWDIQASGQATSIGGEGKTTAEMQTAKTFLDAGWDFVGDTANGTEDIWWIDEGRDYPRLWWEPRKYGGGTGEPNDPYLIFTAEQMNAIGTEPNDWDKHFKLMADIDLAAYTGTQFHIIGRWFGTQDANNKPFTGVFDGNGKVIRHFTWTSTDQNAAGLFAYVAWAGDPGPVLMHLGLEDVNVCAENATCVGAMAALADGADVNDCHVTGSVRGGAASPIGGVGGLIGYSYDCAVEECYAAVTVEGTANVGGLCGYQQGDGYLRRCYSSGSVSGKSSVGGLAGSAHADTECCYSESTVTGKSIVGGLVGCLGAWGRLSYSYARGAVTGTTYVGGLVGDSGCYSEWDNAEVIHSYWDVQTSGQAESHGGTGKTTAEMHAAKIFLDAGWDFVGETANGTEDLWWIDEGKDYPRLWWELSEEPKANP